MSVAVSMAIPISTAVTMVWVASLMSFSNFVLIVVVLATDLVTIVSLVAICLSLVVQQEHHGSGRSCCITCFLNGFLPRHFLTRIFGCEGFSCLCVLLFHCICSIN